MVQITKLTVVLVVIAVVTTIAVEYKELFETENYTSIITSTIMIIGASVLGYYQGRKK